MPAAEISVLVNAKDAYEVRWKETWKSASLTLCPYTMLTGSLKIAVVIVTITFTIVS